ncbi:MAG: DUF2510 domain-containing protein [Actinobacteria bacterium]|nr:DUF2510 domain-containing protein [Actinomycetota bacterium]
MRLWPRTIGFRIMAAGAMAIVGGYAVNFLAWFVVGVRWSFYTAIGYVIFLGFVLVIIGAVVAFVRYLTRPKPPTAAPVVVGPVAGWLPDPTDPTMLRYWDGTDWTGQTARRDP